MPDFKTAAKAANLRRRKRRVKAKLIFSGKPKRPTYKKAMKRAVAACHDYIKARDLKRYGLCFYCGVNPIQCAMHRVKSTYLATRLHEDNIHGGCNSCNAKDTPWGDTERFSQVYRQKLGVELLDSMIELSRSSVKFSVEDLLFKEAYFIAAKARVLGVAA